MAKKRKSKKTDFSKHAQAFSIAVFIAVSSLLLFTSSNEPLTGYVNAVQTIALQQADTSLTFEVRNVDGIDDVTAYFSETIKNAVITFDKVDKRDFAGVVYSSIEVASKDASKISEMDITLRLEKKRLSELNLNKADVVFYVNNQVSPATYTHEDKFSYYFTTRAWEMGEWTIGMKYPVVVQESAPEETVSEVAAKPTPVEPVPIVEPEVAPVEKETSNSFIEFFKKFFRK